MRTPLIAANWKMHKAPKDAAAFLDAFLPELHDQTGTEIALFPSAVCLPGIIEAARGTRVSIGAQNMHWLSEGAYTGDISAPMLTAIGCTHILIGHSERRQYSGETDEQVNLKLKTALAHRLIPVVCIGEHLDKRQSSLTAAVLRWQLAAALSGITPEQAAPIVIAYEPVWAIGTGVVATPDQAAEAHGIIRHEVANLLGNIAAEKMRILYGGSVKPDNIARLMSEPGIDGALVGGASLDPASFSQIVRNATTAA
ncbi:MAG TPA: triose-phosphate isomerase [Granulicella sp.]